MHSQFHYTWSKRAPSQMTLYKITRYIHIYIYMIYMYPHTHTHTHICTHTECVYVPYMCGIRFCTQVMCLLSGMYVCIHM